MATDGKLKTAKVTQDGSGNATATITQKGDSNAAQIQQVLASGGSSINSALKFKKSIFPEDASETNGAMRARRWGRTVNISRSVETRRLNVVITVA